MSFGQLRPGAMLTRMATEAGAALRKLTAEEFLLMHANYVFEHPAEKFEDSYKGPFHVAYGRDKKLAGELGEWLCFIIQDQQESICIAQPIDGVKILPGKNYTAESLEAAHNEKG